MVRDYDHYLFHIEFLELLASMDREWMRQAACRDLPTKLFFPGQGEDTSDAKAVCAMCPVRRQCLDYALETGEQFGIWGGLGTRTRRLMRDRQRKGVA